MKFSAGLGLLISSILYTATSYLLFLRDGNFITRLASALDKPELIDQSFKLVDQIDDALIHPNTLSLILLTISLLSMIWFYLRSLSEQNHQLDLLHILTVVVIFLSFPSLSTDVFDYHATNRVIFVHQANPWTATPNQFVEKDSIINLGSWIHRQSVYPPLSLVLNSLVYYMFGSNPLWAVVGFKTLSVSFYIATIYLIGVIAKNQKLNVYKSQFLFAANPLILTEFIGNAHNDLPMIFFFLLSLHFLNIKKITTSGITFALSFLSKITIVLSLPLVIFRIFIKLKAKHTVNFLLSFLGSLTLGFIFLGKSLGHYLITLQDQNQTFLQSFPYLLKIVISSLFGTDNQLSVLVTLIPLVIFSLVYLKSLSSKTNLEDNLTIIMLAFLLIQITMLHPWYFSWVLILMPFIKSLKLQWITVATTVSAVLRYLTFNLSLYYLPHHPSWQIIIYLSMLTPVLVMILVPSRWYTERRFLKILTCKNS